MTHRTFSFTFSLVCFLILTLCAGPAFGATLTAVWDSPTTNEDGSPLTDLGGFKLYYGTASGVYSNVLDIGMAVQCAPGTADCKYSFSLPKGLYFFTMTAYDKDGAESVYAKEISKKVTGRPSVVNFKAVTQP